MSKRESGKGASNFTNWRSVEWNKDTEAEHFKQQDFSQTKIDKKVITWGRKVPAWEITGSKEGEDKQTQRWAIQRNVG